MADPTNDKALHQLMQPRIDDSSLYVLCEYIKADVPGAADLDSSRLPGDTLTVKSMSLIRYCRQRQILHTLIENLHLVRPDMLNDNYAACLTWANAQDDPHATSPATSQPAPPAPPADPTVTPAKSHLRDELIEELYPELGAAMKSDDWNRAISLGQNILAFNPSHQPTKDKLKLAYFNRGLLYSVMERYEQALADYNQAIRLDPNFAWAYNNRGEIYRRKGDKARAIADYVRALELGDEEQRRRAEQALKELGVR